MDKGPVDKFERTIVRQDRPEKIRLGELLVELRLITNEQLRNALEQHLKTGKKVGKVMVESGYITEDQLAQAIGTLYRRPFVDLKTLELPQDIVRRLPEAQSRHHKAIVIEDRRTSYVVGFADPSDLFAYDEVSRLLKSPIEVAVVSEAMLLQMLERCYRKTDQISGFAKELEQDIGDATTFGATNQSVDDSAVARLVSSIFEDAIRQNASDIHIEPQEYKLIVRFRVDGIMQASMESDPKIAPAVLMRLKIISGLNISEKRLPQDGRFNISVREAPVDVRLSTLPTQYGESAVMRILSTGGGPRKLEKIGMPRPRPRALPAGDVGLERTGAGDRPDR